MPAPLDVDREQVRMLAMQVGPREAARRMGLSEDTVLAWSRREGWLDGIRLPPPLPKSMQPTAIAALKRPADALRDCLAEDGQATRVAGMRYARRVIERAAQVAEDEPDKALESAQNVKGALQSAAIAGGWASNVQVDVRLGVFGPSDGGQVTDV
jgi:hypothetical protein